jgi:hypothetical protein
MNEQEFTMFVVSALKEKIEREKLADEVYKGMRSMIYQSPLEKRCEITYRDIDDYTKDEIEMMDKKKPPKKPKPYRITSEDGGPIHNPGSVSLMDVGCDCGNTMPHVPFGVFCRK